jgi:hypothetical protein
VSYLLIFAGARLKFATCAGVIIIGEGALPLLAMTRARAEKGMLP